MKKTLCFVSTVTVMLMLAVFANAKISDVSVTQSKKVGSCGETVSVTANGGTNGVKYKFVYMKDNWKSWGVIQDYSTKNNAVFTTKIPGDYKIYVDVLDTNGDKNTKILDYKVSSMPSLSVPTVWSVGDGLSVTGNSIVGGATYKFVYMRNNWQDWGVIQNFNSNKNVNFTPRYTGGYYIYLDVKDKYGNIESTKQYINVINGIKPVISADSTVAPKRKLNISSASSGNLQGAKYKFVYMRNNWQDWGVIQDFSTNSSITYSFPSVGSYKIYMDVKDSKGNIVSASKDVKVVLTGNLKLSADSVEVGKELTLTGSSNSSNSTYKFVYMRDNWQDWGVIQDFGKSNSATFKPKKYGTYYIYLDVKDEYGNEINTSKALTVKNFTPNMTLEPPNPKIGDKVKVTATGGKTYKFVWSYDNWSKWGVAQDYSSQNTVEIPIEYKGAYSIYVDAKDEYGNVSTVYKEFHSVGIAASSLKDLSEQEVIEKIGPLCTKDQQNSDILASVTMAQFILESGYGQTELAQNANNCFGMKVNLSGNTWPGSTWDGKSKYTKYTYEQDANGNQYQISADFRKYPCIDDSLADHSAYLLGAKNGSNLRYAGLKGEKDYRKAITIIKNGGYATDVNYINKICNIIERWNLTRFDLKK